jgi:hypothetical protein
MVAALRAQGRRPAMPYGRGPVPMNLNFNYMSQGPEPMNINGAPGARASMGRRVSMTRVTGMAARCRSRGMRFSAIARACVA